MPGAVVAIRGQFLTEMEAEVAQEARIEPAPARYYDRNQKKYPTSVTSGRKQKQMAAQCGV